METSDGMEIVYISSQHHDRIDICQSFAFVLFVFCENAFSIKKKQNKTKNHVTKQNKLTNKQFLIVLLANTCTFDK